VVENIIRQRELGLGPVEAAAVGTEEVQRAIVASTLTTIAVFGPIVYVRGVAGEMFGSLSFAVAFALGASVLVAITLLPAMAARWTVAPALDGSAAVDDGGKGRKRNIFTRFLDSFEASFARFAAWYERMLALALDHRWPVLGVA